MHKFFELIKLDVWSYPEADSSYTRMNRLIIGRWIGSRENGGKHPCCKLRRLLYMATETLLSTKTSMHRTKFIQPSTSSQHRDVRTRYRGCTVHHPDFRKNLIVTLMHFCWARTMITTEIHACPFRGCENAIDHKPRGNQEGREHC